MKSFDSDLKKYADKVRLTAAERGALRERIFSYMEYHPLSKGSRVSAPQSGFLPAEPFVMVYITRRVMQYASGFLALTLIALPFAAERSVPGEVLYLVKTGITEPVQAQLAGSTYEKIEFETKLMERRIAEARSLASQGKLTADIEEQLAETVKEHTKSVATKIEALEAEDADGAAIARIAFNSTLEVQSAVLAATSDEGTSTVQSIIIAVNDAIGESAAQEESNPAPSYEGLLARVELETTRAYELFEAVKQSATTDEVQSIERRLNDINRLIEESRLAYAAPTLESGDSIALMATEIVDEGVAIMDTATVTDAVVTELTEGAPAPESVILMTEPVISREAPDKLASTLGLIQKLIVFMTDIDVREVVALDTLVPVVLSDEERINRIRENIASHDEVVDRIVGVMPGLEDAARQEKINLGLARIAELKVLIDTTLVGSDVELAEQLFLEYDALVADIQNMSADQTIYVIEAPEVLPVDQSTSTDAEAVGTSTPEVVTDTN